MGIVYPMPFFSEAERAQVSAQDALSFWSAIWWYGLHPHAGFLHLFGAVNHDFPTTYVTTFNSIVSIGFNALGLLMVSAGMVTLVTLAWDIRKNLTTGAWLRASRAGSGLVILVVATMWGMTAFTAVETRYGIIPWCGLAVAAAYGAITWVGEFKAGRRRWGQAVAAVGLASSGLWLSRWLLSTVEPVQRAIAFGC